MASISSFFRAEILCRKVLGGNFFVSKFCSLRIIVMSFRESVES